jgi:solute carrier family 13 (sodium-dependent dicarboxylate transporter), member 2/3/5
MSTAVLSIIIIGVAIVSFMLEKIPLALTAMLASLAMGVFHIMPYSNIYDGFGSSVVMMVAGMMIIGDCLFETGLAEIVGAKIVNGPFAKNERLLLFIMMVVACFASAFLSNSATVATFIPLIASIVYKSNGRLNNRFLLMGVGFAAAIGGAGTMVGSTAQLVAQSILVKTAGCRPLGFFEFTPIVAILCVVLCLYMCTIGYNIQKKVFDFADVSPVVIKEVAEGEAPKKLDFKMIVSGAVILLCILGFIFNVWNVGVIALVGASVCLACGCKNLKKALRDLDWNTLVILGAAQGFATGLDVSGGGKIIANFVVNIFGGVDASVYAIVIAGVVISTVLTNFMSNTAVLAMMTPIFINIGFQLHVHPEVLVIGLIIGGSNALATPIGTPCVTQTLVGGYRYKDYVYVGLPITIILTVLTCILLPLMYGFTPL